MEGIIKEYHRLQEFPRVLAITLFHHSEYRAFAFLSGTYSARQLQIYVPSFISEEFFTMVISLISFNDDAFYPIVFLNSLFINPN